MPLGVCSAGVIKCVGTEENEAVEYIEDSLICVYTVLIKNNKAQCCPCPGIVILKGPEGFGKKGGNATHSLGAEETREVEKLRKKEIAL